MTPAETRSIFNYLRRIESKVDNDYIGVDEVAHIKGVSTRTVRRWVKERKLRALAGPGPLRFLRSDVTGNSSEYTSSFGGAHHPISPSMVTKEDFSRLEHKLDKLLEQDGSKDLSVK